MICSGCLCCVSFNTNNDKSGNSLNCVVQRDVVMIFEQQGNILFYTPFKERVILTVALASIMPEPTTSVGTLFGPK